MNLDLMRGEMGKEEKGPPSRGLAEAPPRCWLQPQNRGRLPPRPPSPSDQVLPPPTHSNVSQFLGLPTQSWAGVVAATSTDLILGHLRNADRGFLPTPLFWLWSPKGKGMGFLGKVPRS